MKVRVCPDCGTHNPENAWSCADCGTTLSVDALIDIESGSPMHASPFAGHANLSEVSTYFEADVKETIQQHIRIDDSMKWGCNYARISKNPPYIFGYLIITSRNFIQVEFKSDTSTKLEDLLFGQIPETPPVRHQKKMDAAPGLDEPFGIDSSKVSTRPWVAVGLLKVPYPGQPLTQNELNTRRVRIKALKELAAVRCDSNWFNEHLIKSLVVLFRGEDEDTLIFYSPHLVEKAKKILSEFLRPAASRMFPGDR